MKPVLLALTGLFSATSFASAGLAVYTDRALWQAAAGPLSFTENFNSYTSDTIFRTADLQVAGLTLHQEGRDLGNRNLVDVSPFGFNDHSGSPNLSLYLNATEPASAGTSVRLNFLQPNQAFGALTYFGDGGEGATLDIFDGASLLGSVPFSNGNGDFRGYLLTGGQTATSALLRSTRTVVGFAGEGLVLDDLVGVNASPVPEPGTAGFGMALLFAAGITARRKRQAVR